MQGSHRSLSAKRASLLAQALKAPLLKLVLVLNNCESTFFLFCGASLCFFTVFNSVFSVASSMLVPLQDPMTRIARPMTQRPSILLGVQEVGLDNL
jgi:hypothetical protein